jgi:hypothetical protein
MYSTIAPDTREHDIAVTDDRRLPSGWIVSAHRGRRRWIAEMKLELVGRPSSSISQTMRSEREVSR